MRTRVWVRGEEMELSEMREGEVRGLWAELRVVVDFWRERVRKGELLRRDPDPDWEGRWEARLRDASRPWEPSDERMEGPESLRACAGWNAPGGSAADGRWLAAPNALKSVRKPERRCGLWAAEAGGGLGGAGGRVGASA